MIDRLAEHMATHLNRFTMNELVDREYVRYRIAEIIHTILIFASVSIIGTMTVGFSKSFIAAFSFWLLRLFTGGFHLKTLEGCAIFSVSLITFINFLPEWNSLFFTASAFLVMIMFCKRKGRDKLVAMAIILVNVIIGSETMAYALLAQSLTLIYEKEGVSEHVERTHEAS